MTLVIALQPVKEHQLMLRHKLVFLRKDAGKSKKGLKRGVLSTPMLPIFSDSWQQT